MTMAWRSLKSSIAGPMTARRFSTLSTSSSSTARTGGRKGRSPIPTEPSAEKEYTGHIRLASCRSPEMEGRHSLRLTPAGRIGQSILPFGDLMATEGLTVTDNLRDTSHPAGAARPGISLAALRTTPILTLSACSNISASSSATRVRSV
jgi:hypothetical protein